jgi:hypothetical protein
MVAEICNLIHANVSDSLRLTCEVQYSKLLSRAPQRTIGKGKEILTQRARVDLVVSDGPLDLENNPQPKFLIEVKRASAPTSQVDADLRRLAEAKRRYPEARAFLFLISEANRPDRFVDAHGMTRKGKHTIPGSDGYYRVRRTAKAAHAFKKRDRAQYACLVEVYA